MANSSPPPFPADRNELEAAQKFLEQAAIENLVSVLLLGAVVRKLAEPPRRASSSLLAAAWMEAPGQLETGVSHTHARAHTLAGSLLA